MSHHSLAWLLAWTAFAIPNYVGAAETFPRIPPTPADQAEATFGVLHGFRMELLAAEPLVASPVDMAYDEDGRAYACEMNDYPYTDPTTHQAWKDNTTDAPIGRVRLLVDTDGDGDFDRSTVFAEGLSWPTGVACYKGGVFVAATPDVWYLKDTDGDGKADVKRKVFTGFRKFNVQAVMNNLQWGLDNRLYGAGGSNGGNHRTPSWYLNLRAAGRAEVQVGDERWPVTFREVDGDERADCWARLVATYPDFETYQRLTPRRIPVAVLERTTEPAG